MKKQEIIWTVLPQGKTEDNHLRFSVFVSPRLWSEDEDVTELTLGEFPDFYSDEWNWPKKVQEIKFYVVLDTGMPDLPAQAIKPDTELLDADLWAKLFNKNTFVRPFVFKDLQDKAIHSYPVSGVMKYLKNQYRRIGEQSPGTLPLLQPRRDDDGNPIDEDSTLKPLIDDLGALLHPRKSMRCGPFSEQDLQFTQLGPEQGEAIFDYLNGDDKCGDFSPRADSIEKEDPYTWKIIKSEGQVFTLELEGDWWYLYEIQGPYAQLDSLLYSQKAISHDDLPTGFSKQQFDYLQANRFYDRREVEHPYSYAPNAALVPSKPEQPEIDFHHMLAMLGDHPALMRKLGLVLDFTVKDFPPTYTRVRVMADWNDAAPAGVERLDRTPWTWVNDGVPVEEEMDAFTAWPKGGSPLRHGLLGLSEASDMSPGDEDYPPFEICQVDPDGASLKLIHSANSMFQQIARKYVGTFSAEMVKGIMESPGNELEHLKAWFSEILGISLSEQAHLSTLPGNRWQLTDGKLSFELQLTGSHTLHVFQKNPVSFDTPEDAGLAALRTGGIALFKNDRAWQLHEHLGNAAGLNTNLTTNPETNLYADDLLRGYRVDVMDLDAPGPKQWRSLCRRRGWYQFPGLEVEPVGEIADEGYLKGASVTSKDSEAESSLYLHETIFKWTGWSLCAPRPGKTIISKEEVVRIKIDGFVWDETDAAGQWVKRPALIKFLKDYHNVRWVKDDTTINYDSPETISITVHGHNILLELQPDEKMIVTYDGEETPYLYKVEGDGKKQIFTQVVQQTDYPGYIEPPAEEDIEFKVEPVFEAQPGTLPRLRFGHRYRLRVRGVDLGGNDLSSDEFLLKGEPNKEATRVISYCRYEPVIPPVVVPQAAFTEGESVERLVIRSDYHLTTQEYAEQSGIAGYKASNGRHIVPPKTSQQMAETHGMFDPYMGKSTEDYTPDYKTGYEIAVKEKGSLEDEEIIPTPVDPEGGWPEPVIEKVTLKVVNGEEKSYTIHKEDKLPLPYLPDPIARGTALRGLPGFTPAVEGPLEAVNLSFPGFGKWKVLKVPFNLDWPNAFPFRLKIVERPGAMPDDPFACEEVFAESHPPRWDEEERVLTVFLPKGEVARVRYSSYLDTGDLKKMGVWKWLKENKKILEQFARSGSHWMITPYRELTLVHAVQRPLCRPTILPTLAAVKKKIGDTFAGIEGEIHLSAKSTGKASLLAAWDEPVDDLGDTGPRRICRNGQAFELNIQPAYGNTVQLPVSKYMPQRHEFGDTKYRKVNYCLDATTRFREYFHPELTGVKRTYVFQPENLPGTNEERMTNFLLDQLFILSSEDVTYTKNEKLIKVSADVDLLLEFDIDEDEEKYRLAIKKAIAEDEEAPDRSESNYRLREKSREGYVLEAKKRYLLLWDAIGDAGHSYNEIAETALKEFLLARHFISSQESAIFTRTDDAITVSENGSTFELRLNPDRITMTLETPSGDVYFYHVHDNCGNPYLETDFISRRGPARTLEVPNSARPDSPKVAYILPTFGWEEEKDNEEAWTQLSRKRVGGGLRVYLERPWYSSGDGELLGVVLYRTAVRNEMKGLVTQWGMDPIRQTKVPKGLLGIGDFANAVDSRIGLTLEELNDQWPLVHVAGFQPQYNEERGMWYCDIQVKPEEVTSYYPFIRLALARYQPRSIAHAHLSRVVLTDFMQLANDRTLAIRFTNNRKFHVRVTGYAPADSDSNRIEASIEYLPEGAHEEFGWAPVDSRKSQPNPYTLARSAVDEAHYLWSWGADLKLPTARSKGRYRLVVREFERFEADRETPFSLLTISRGANLFTTQAERLVYADIVDLWQRPAKSKKRLKNKIKHREA